MNMTDVQGTLREMWETRPARPRDDRQVAGVATGIARRYDIDPVLVRVGFVVAAFTGIGAALYIAGWILLPDETTDPAAPTPIRSPKAIAMIALVIAAAVTVGSVFSRDGGLVLPAIAVAALLFLLHRSRGDRVAVTPRTPAAPTAGATASPEAPTVTTPAAAAAAGPSFVKEPPSPAPPAWDPLGAAPFAWDLPEPAPAPAPPVQRRRRLPVTSVTLGIALLAGGATAVALLLAGALSLANLPLLCGVVLAVLGSGLVVGAFLRAGRGLIPFALLLSLLTWGVIAAPLDRWQGQGVGEVHETPATLADLDPSYRLAAGEIDLDLRNLDLAAVPGGNNSEIHTRVDLGGGEVQVLLPPDADVTLNASAGVGRVSFGDRADSGPGAKINVTKDLGADGVESGRLLVLDIETGAGNVEVHRG